MKIKPVDLQAQYLAYKAETDAAIHSVLADACYIGGKEIDQLEEELALRCGAKHAICCSSGTDALLLALMAAGIGAGDEVITVSFTFVATAETTALLGARSVFIDIKESTALMNEELIEDAISPATRAIIPVSLFGQTCDMDAIYRIAQKHRLVVIEDAAQSFGAGYKDRFSCNLSEYACTSFYPAKPLGCYGDGGAVFTNDEAKMQKIRRLLNHGQNGKYAYSEVGINGRLDTIQAAILRVKLKYHAKEMEARRKIASFYDKELTGTALTPLRIPDYNKSSYAQYSLYAPPGTRDNFRAQLAEAGIPTAIYYPLPLHLQEAYKKNTVTHKNLRATETAANNIMSIPMHPFLTEEERDYIVAHLKACKPAGI